MDDNTEIVIEVIKQQAALFLLDAAEFFPFGTYINLTDKIVPLAVKVVNEDDRPDSESLIEMLEGYFKANKENYVVGAIGVDVAIKKEDVKVDALRIQLFYPSGEQRTVFYTYLIGNDSVEFTEYEL